MAINTVLPGIVHTNIIPLGMVVAVSPGASTFVSQIVSAYLRFLDHEDASLSGEALKCAAMEQIFVPCPEYLNGKISQRACTVWDVSELPLVAMPLRSLMVMFSRCLGCIIRNCRDFQMPFHEFEDRFLEWTGYFGGINSGDVERQNASSIQRVNDSIYVNVRLLSRPKKLSCLEYRNPQ